MLAISDRDPRVYSTWRQSIRTFCVAVRVETKRPTPSFPAQYPNLFASHYVHNVYSTQLRGQLESGKNFAAFALLTSTLAHKDRILNAPPTINNHDLLSTPIRPICAFRMPNKEDTVHRSRTALTGTKSTCPRANQESSHFKMCRSAPDSNCSGV